MQDQSKNNGIELLRIIAMFMIVVLHILGIGQNGIIERVSPNSLQFHMAWMLEITCFCAVNIYGLISGYVLCDKTFRLSRLINLWFSTAFYTIAITVIANICGLKSLTINSLLDAFFPISRQQYWYLSSYCGVLLLAPFLNIALAKVEGREVKKILIPATLVISILPTLFSRDPLSTHVGYSTIWLCVMYLVGGWLKKADIKSRMKSWWLVAIFGIMVLVTYFSKIILIYITKNWFNIDNECNVLITYISPTIIISSVALFLLVIKGNFSAFQARIICFFSPMTLGVYIIHTNSFIWPRFAQNLAGYFVQYGAVKFIIAILAAVLVVYLACTAIEFFRIKLFQLVHVRQFSEYLERKFSALIDQF